MSSLSKSRRKDCSGFFLYTVKYDEKAMSKSNDITLLKKDPQTLQDTI